MSVFRNHLELGQFEFNPPALMSAIVDVEAAIGIDLPPSYRAFLLEADGGEGPVGRTGYLILWPVDQIVSMNESYGVGEYARGFLLIGSDGAGEGLAIDLRSQPLQFALLPFVGMAESDALHLGSEFSEVLVRLGDADVGGRLQHPV